MTKSYHKRVGMYKYIPNDELNKDEESDNYIQGYVVRYCDNDG